MVNRKGGKTMSDDFGWCDLHEEPVGEGNYEWKGCWGCWHFTPGDDFPYVSVSKAVDELGVSGSTVVRWVKKNRLEGRVFEQGSRTSSLPSPKKYHISKQSVLSIQRRREATR